MSCRPVIADLTAFVGLQCYYYRGRRAINGYTPLRNTTTPRHSGSSFTKVLFFTVVFSLFSDTMYCSLTVTKKLVTSTSRQRL
jgi:hypothetical protein